MDTKKHTRFGRVAVLGAGSWGTAVGNLIAANGLETLLWAREKNLVDTINQNRRNEIYHPNIKLHDNVTATHDLVDAVTSCDLVVIAIPSQFIRDTLATVANAFTGKVCVSVSKGIEQRSLKTVSEVILDVTQGVTKQHVAVLSGPSFAAEVMEKKPTAVTLACVEKSTCLELQPVFNCKTFRTYLSDDLVGVEIGGALKNVIAIGVGILDGLGFGHNSRAALITRAIVEMTRLTTTLGGQVRTLSGLAGVGDLILTCTGDLSRNRRLGLRIGKGETVKQIQQETSMVAEGVATSKSAYQLARKHTVDMPIVEQVYSILHEGKSPKDALEDLLARDPKEEFAS